MEEDPVAEHTHDGQTKFRKIQKGENKTGAV
jgi:hypothetical protein